MLNYTTFKLQDGDSCYFVKKTNAISGKVSDISVVCYAYKKVIPDQSGHALPHTLHNSIHCITPHITSSY